MRTLAPEGQLDMTNLSRVLRLALAATAMALAANCFLKYLWWTACYSAWNGIPKLAEQWKAAGTHASFNGWSVILLELASIALLFSTMRKVFSGTSKFLASASRLTLALLATIAGTGLFALALSWAKQSPMH